MLNRLPNPFGQRGAPRLDIPKGSFEAVGKIWATRTISALRAYLVKRGKGSKYYAIVDGAVSNFLVQRDLTLSGATSVVVIDAKGNPETLGEFSPENTNRGT